MTKRKTKQRETFSRRVDRNSPINTYVYITYISTYHKIKKRKWKNYGKCYC